MTKGVIQAVESQTQGANESTQVTATKFTQDGKIKLGLDVYVRGITATVESSESVALADNETHLNSYAQVISVPASTDTKIFEYTVPASFNLYVQFAESESDNISEFWVIKDNGSPITIMKKRNWWHKWDVKFDLMNGDSGMLFLATEKIQIFARHESDMVGEYNSRIFGVLKAV